MKRQFVWINLVVLTVVIGMNAVANILPLNDMTTGELSERVNVLFTPAGYVFSIWSVIYATLAIWVIRSFFTSHRGDKNAVNNIGWLFTWNGIFNISWLFLFHYEFYPWTILPMTALLISLIMIYKKIRASGKVTFWTKVPFSIYTGWISVAAIVNIGILFNTIGFGLEEGFILSNVVWTALVILLGGILAYLFTRFLGDTLYSMVFIWAYIGIYIERNDESIWISGAAITVAAILGLYVVVYIIKKQYILRLEG